MGEKAHSDQSLEERRQELSRWREKEYRRVQTWGWAAGAACGRALGWLLGSTGEGQGGGSHHVHERRDLGHPARAPIRSRPAPTTRKSL